MKRSIALTAGILLGLATALVPAQSNAVDDKASTYPGCSSSLILREQYPLQNDGTDIIHPVNSVDILPNWGPSPTFNGSSMSPNGGMLYGPTNVNPQDGDWCFAGTLKTNDPRYNMAQFGTLQAGQPALKITGASSYAQDDTGYQVRLGTGVNLSNNIKHYIIFQKIGQKFDLWYTNNAGTLIHAATKTDNAFGSMHFTGAEQPLMLGGKYQPGKGYNVDDMCGDGAYVCYIWNVQFAWRSALA